MPTWTAYWALLALGLARNLDLVREVAVQPRLIGETLVAVHRLTIDRIVTAVDSAMNRPTRLT